jgi:hypothetical protein
MNKEAAMSPIRGKRRTHTEMATARREAKWAKESWPRRTVKKGLWALLALLGGCSLVPGYADYVKYGEIAARTGIEDIRHANDLTAQGFKAASCGVSLGAWTRLPRQDQRAFMMLCTGEDIGAAPSLPFSSLSFEEQDRIAHQQLP